VWVDRNGTEQPTGAAERPYAQPRLAPDRRRVAVVLRGPAEDVWSYDLVRRTLSRMTFDGNSAYPVWSGDGRRLVFASGRAGPYNIYARLADGSGTDERLLTGDLANLPISWSQDGRTLAFVTVNAATGQDIWLLQPDTKETRVFFQTPFREGAPVFSPDGRWLAYVSDESGRGEVYVRPVPGPGEQFTISTDGGNEPVWARSANRLYYRVGNAMMAVDITTTPTFSAGTPRKLFEGPYERSGVFWPNYDVTPDGQRFLMIKSTDEVVAAVQINVVLNWSEELKQRVLVK
jgi:Tol biopolymer transport system component